MLINCRLLTINAGNRDVLQWEDLIIFALTGKELTAHHYSRQQINQQPDRFWPSGNH